MQFNAQPKQGSDIAVLPSADEANANYCRHNVARQAAKDVSAAGKAGFNTLFSDHKVWIRKREFWVLQPKCNISVSYTHLTLPTIYSV